MADSSWDNQGGGPSARQGMSTWGKLALGCGVALILATATCVGSCLYLGKQVEKDPKGFEQKVLGFVKQFIQDDWEDLRRLVEQLGSDQGSRELYRAAPGLRDAYPSEEAFLEAARGWRKVLEPLPKEIPDLQGHDFSYNTRFGGRVQLSYRQKNGAQVRITWSGKRRKDVPRASQLLAIEVRP